MVDIARDPRWGRIMEGAGEDPFLGSAMAAAQVRGFQGAPPEDGQFASLKPTLKTEEARTAEFNHALDLIKQSDIAVLVLGELQNMSGERASRSSLDLLGKQPAGRPTRRTSTRLLHPGSPQTPGHTPSHT